MTGARDLVPRPGRDPWNDGARGLCLALMMIMHLPGNPLKAKLFAPFGFVPVAESFVLLAGVSSGLHYGWLRRAKGAGEARRRAWTRAGQIYLTHLLIFSVVWLAGFLDPSLVARWAVMPHSMQPAWPSLGLGAILLYQPALLDILPMYCVFVFVTPWALARIEAGHTGRLAAVSLALWVAAQIPHPSVTQLLFGLAPPYFDLLAWQLLFLAGLFAGALEPAHTRWIRSRGAVALAVAILLAMEAVRWGGPWGGPKRWPGMDRPTLEALRLLLFFAIAVAFAGLSRHLPRVIARPFEALGRASLPVYAFSVVVCYGSFAYWSRLSRSERAWWVVALILTLYIPALASRAMKSRRWGTPRS